VYSSSAVSFLVMIGCALGILFVWACGIASGLFLIAALFSGTMSLFTHSQHAFRTVFGFLAYAAAPFVLIAAISYYYGKLTDKLKGRQHRLALDRTSSSRPPELTAAR
jgi:hypothetical protein